MFRAGMISCCNCFVYSCLAMMDILFMDPGRSMV